MYPKVSVITVTHKKADLLSRTIDSVLRQTYPNIQVIAVDNNAAFPEQRLETEKIMEKYKDDPRVRFIVSPNASGSGPARNAGAQNCDGEYISFLDSGDEYLPAKTESQLKFMMMHGLDFSLTDYEDYNSKGKLIGRGFRPYITNWQTENLLENHLVFSFAPAPSFMIKRDFLFEIGGFRNVPSGEDFMLVLDALEYAELHTEKKFGYVPNSYLKLYAHDEDTSEIEEEIRCENMLYKIKLSDKYPLSKNEIRRIDYNHYRRLAGLYSKNKNFAGCVSNKAKAFMTIPMLSIKELI